MRALARRRAAPLLLSAVVIVGMASPIWGISHHREYYGRVAGVDKEWLGALAALARERYVRVAYFYEGDFYRLRLVALKNELVLVDPGAGPGEFLRLAEELSITHVLWNLSVPLDSGLRDYLGSMPAVYGGRGVRLVALRPRD